VTENDQSPGQHVYTADEIIAAWAAMTRPCSDTAREPDGLPCPGVLTFNKDDVQARCPVCGGWAGRFAPAGTTQALLGVVEPPVDR